MYKIFYNLFLLLLINSLAKAQLVFPNVYVQYDSVWVYKNLQLVPIKFVNNAVVENRKIFPQNIITLQQAMQQKQVSIKEINFEKGADVGVLVIKNKTNKNILLNAGEIITGGKQDRVIAETKIIKPQSGEQYISVFCIEKGRWDDKPKPFAYKGSVDIGLRKKIDINKYQQQIWKYIEQQFESRKEKSETYPYIQLKQKIEKTDTAYMNYFTRKFQQSDSSYAGFIALANNKIIACEIFALPIYTIMFYKEMFSSFIAAVTTEDSIAKTIINIQLVKTFANNLLGSEILQEQYLQTHGKADKMNGKTVHLIAYGN
ncbi:MAG: hypothetical protein JSR09_08845 [Bacteroidetes bacterium]|nr:hypothetical protein [Bacteroidota bacterium]MBS1649801.1 hypothetical protein [Bacteroidota bacterium]